MKKKDYATNFSNPMLLSAIYFGLLSVVGTILINALLSILDVQQIVPLYKAILWGMIVASCTGACFGKQIISCKAPYKLKTFLIGFLMVLATLPIFTLGILLLMQGEHSVIFDLHDWPDFIATFFSILGYSYALFGFPLAIASGLAAMYLRSILVYNVMDTHLTENEKKNPGRRRKLAEKTPS